jgi:pimeloyl-ACP methyl ester carboxylesterase
MPRLVPALRWAVTLALGGALMAGCAEAPTAPLPGASTSASPSPGPSLAPVGAECRAAATQGLTLRLVNAVGGSIAAVDLGSGPIGVVLAHQSDASLCQWLPYAQVLAAKGYRVLAFDFAGYGSSSVPQQKTYVEDLRTAVAYLRDRGTSRVVIMGASMGATMSVVAAAAITPPVDGVIALSPPVTFDGVNAEKAAPSLKTPALYVAGDGRRRLRGLRQGDQPGHPGRPARPAGGVLAAARHPVRGVRLTGRGGGARGGGELPRGPPAQLANGHSEAPSEPGRGSRGCPGRGPGLGVLCLRCAAMIAPGRPGR